MIVEREAFALVDLGSARGRISTAFTLKTHDKNKVGTNALYVPIGVSSHFCDDSGHFFWVIWNVVDRQFLVLCANE